MLFIGSTEIVFILFVVVIFFGADKIPEIAKGLGKGMRQLRDASSDIKQEITKSAKDVNASGTNLTQEIQSEIDKVKDEVEDVAGSIKRNQ